MQPCCNSERHRRSVRTMTEVSSKSMARDLSDLVNRVVYREERVILTRRGRRVAALVPLRDLQQLEERAARPASKAEAG